MAANNNKKTNIQIDFDVQGLKGIADQIKGFSKDQSTLGKAAASALVNLQALINRIEGGAEFSKSQLKAMENNLNSVARSLRKLQAAAGETVGQSQQELQNSISATRGTVTRAQNEIVRYQEELAKLQDANAKTAERALKETKAYEMLLKRTGSEEQAIAEIRRLSAEEPKLYSKQERALVEGAHAAMAKYREELRGLAPNEEEVRKKIEETNAKLAERVLKLKELERQLKEGQYNLPGASDAFAASAVGLEQEAGKIGDISAQLRPDQKATVKPAVSDSTIGKATKALFRYQIVMNGLKKVTREAVKTIYEMDKALTEMTIATGMSREAASAYTDQIIAIGKATSTAMTDVARLTTEYIKQGRAMEDALVLAEATAKAAKISSLNTSQALEYMTVAINGFQLAATEATRVSDAWALLGTKSATDFADISVAISKVAAQANVAGMSLDFTSAILTKMLETTQEAPESIGTALKTVIARMRELSDYGKTLEDGMNINQVERALHAVGLELRDVNGQFRDMEEVFDDIGRGWDKYSGTQQQAIAQAMAGSRQQSRLLSIFQDYDRTLELVSITQKSAGATMFQYTQYAKGMEAQMNKLQTSWQTFARSLVETDVVISLLDAVSSMFNIITRGIELFGAAIPILLLGLAAILILKNNIARATERIVANEAAEITTKWVGVGLLAKQLALRIAGKKAEDALNVAKATGLGITAATYAIILAAVAVLALLIWGIVAISKNSDNFANNTRKAQENLSKVYELETKIAETEGTLDRYIALNKQLVRTNAELEEQLRLEKELQDKYGTTLRGEDLEGFVQRQIEKDRQEVRERQAEAMQNVAAMRRNQLRDSRVSQGVPDEALTAYSNAWQHAIEDLEGVNEEAKHALGRIGIDKGAIYMDVGGSEASASAAIARTAREMGAYFEAAQAGSKEASAQFEIFNNHYLQMGKYAQKALLETNPLFEYLTNIPHVASGFLNSMDKMNIGLDEMVGLFEELSGAGLDTKEFAAIANLFIESGDNIEEAYARALARIEELGSVTEASRGKIKKALADTVGFMDEVAVRDYVVGNMSSIAGLQDIYGKLLSGEGMSVEEIESLKNAGILTPEVVAEFGKKPDQRDAGVLLSATQSAIAAEKAKVEERIRQNNALLKIQVEQLKVQAAVAASDDERKPLLEQIEILESSILASNLMLERSKENILQYTKEHWEVERQLAKAANKKLSTEERIEALRKAQAARAGLQANLLRDYSQFAGKYEVVGGKAYYTGEGFGDTATEQAWIEFSKKYGELFGEEIEAEFTSIMEEAYKEQEDALKKSLDERRKLYQKYFDSLDFEDEQDSYDKQRQALISAIARLSTANDSVSQQRLREYQKELGDLEKEQLANQREMRRDAIEEQFDTTEERISTQFELMGKGMESLWEQFANGAISAIEVVHGALVGMGYAGELPDLPSASSYIEGTTPPTPTNTANNVTIENIDIDLVVQGELDKDADIQRIGNSLVDVMISSISRRGITINAKQ